MFNQLRRVFRDAVLGAVVVLGAGGSAHATLVVGVFDPDFGGSLTGTNFSGTATFSISQKCLDLGLPGGAFIYATYNCGGVGSGMGFLGAHVVFSGAQVGQVDFLSDPSAILGMYVKNGQVIGVQSKVIGPEPSTLPGTPMFDLLFGMLNPVVGNDEDHYPATDSDGGDLDDLPSSAFQTTSMFIVAGGCTPGTAQNACEQSRPAQTKFVPEPGTLALVLGALGAGWLTRSKKRRGRGAALAV